MRKYLNNPRIVLPIALFAMLWVCHSYGLLDQLLPDFSTQSQSVAATQVVIEKEVITLTPSGRVMQGLVRDQWLPRNWRKSSAIKNEPFVANYSFEKSELPDESSAPEVVEEVVVIDPSTLDQYIAEHLGLDELGFFVRFGSVNKREGDLLMTKGGRELQLGQIAISDTERSEAAHQASVAAVLSGMRLYGVMDQIVNEASSDAADAADTLVALESTKDPASVEQVNSAFIGGGVHPSGIYRHGDIICQNPVLGLSKIEAGRVVIVDRYKNQFILKLD